MSKNKSKSMDKDLGRLRMQVQWSRLLAIVEEQAQALLRTSFSTIVRECGDLSTGIFDLQSRMIAQAVTGTPGHVNTMAASVRHFLRYFPAGSMEPGDIYVTNDPWMGTGHLNDFVVVTPAFHGGRLVALLCCTSHLMDVGGMGYGPDGRDVYMEGFCIPPVKLAERGQMNALLMDVIKANTRLPVEVEGDIYSLVNSNEIGIRGIRSMLQEFGLADIAALADHVCSATRTAALACLEPLPRGRFRYEMVVDGYRQPVCLAATVTMEEGRIGVDFAGSSAPSDYGINVPLTYASAYSTFALMSALMPGIPNNSGSLDLFTVSAPEVCILNAQRPAPVAIRHVLGQMLPDVVFGCLRQFVPGKVPAEGASCLWNINLQGMTQAGKVFATTVTTNGGTGARPGKHGLSVTSYPSGVRGTPVEVLESAIPLTFWKKEIRQGSGGAGAWRGGDGVDMRIENVSTGPITLLAAFDRIDHPPRGVDGGLPGAAGYVGLADGSALLGKGAQAIQPGQTLVIRTPGGGGLGSPAADASDAVAAADALAA